MSKQRWTDETQDLVADLLYRGRDGDGHVDAVRILTALADAGLLAKPRRATKSRHGTTSRYVNQRCRCEACAAAWTEYQLAYRQRRKESA